MQAFPLFIKLQDRPVLLVGGTDAAAAKLRLLLKAGARCTVIAAEPSADLLALLGDARVRFHQRAFEAGDIDGHQLVFSAHDDEADDRAVVDAAKARQVLVNVVDRPALTDLVMPAVVDRGEVVVAISTQGAAPVLSRKVRALIEGVLPQRIGRLAAFAGRFRSAVHSRLTDGIARRRFWEDFFDGPVAAAVLAGDERRAAREVIAAINRRQGPVVGESHKIDVTDDVEALTLGDLRRLREADIVLHDGRVAAEIIEFARRDCRRVELDALEIEARRAAEVAAGHRVVVLRQVKHAAAAAPRLVAGE
ncbi:MAG TPA: NAD(P)-dependent oxidoreductase [Dongiaceae bacterium]|nr:NAD(P)-dependent oxidoreductase [Dongiaceae bacterium]